MTASFRFFSLTDPSRDVRWRGDQSRSIPTTRSTIAAPARALVNQPALLLADEPTGNLDTQTSIEIMGVFQKLNDQGITIIMVTHELDIASYAKRNIIMRDGQVVSDKAVEHRLNSDAELARLREAHQSVKLSA